MTARRAASRALNRRGTQTKEEEKKGKKRGGKRGGGGIGSGRLSFIIRPFSQEGGKGKGEEGGKRKEKNRVEAGPFHVVVRLCVSEKKEGRGKRKKGKGGPEASRTLFFS